jgi:hypothetical protein
MNTSSRVFFANKSSIVPGLGELELVEDIIGLGDNSQRDIVEDIKEAIQDVLGGEEIPKEEPKEETPKEHIVNLSFIGKLKKIFKL